MTHPPSSSSLMFGWPRLESAAAGLLLWALFVLVPAVMSGSDMDRGPVRLWIAGGAPLGVLGVGLAIRSPWLLLFFFPLALALAPALQPALIGSQFYGFVPFLAVAGALLLYLQRSLSALRPPLRTADSRNGRSRRWRGGVWLASLLAVGGIGMLIYRIGFDPLWASNIAVIAPETRESWRAATALLILGVSISLALTVGTRFAKSWGRLRAHRDHVTAERDGRAGDTP